jgi:hypothetical protein
MAFSRHSGKQVRLAVFDNEPMARLAEQRLHQEGIPCFLRSLGVGPGATGSAYYLPHALYVHQADEMLAREVLGLAPKEMLKRERPIPVHAPTSAVGLLATLIIIVALAFVVIVFLLARSPG